MNARDDSHSMPQGETLSILPLHLSFFSIFLLLLVPLVMKTMSASTLNVCSPNRCSIAVTYVVALLHCPSIEIVGNSIPASDVVY